VKAGLGVGLLPRFLARPELEAGTLVAPVEGVLSVSEAYFFSYPSDGERSQALAVFEAWLADVAAESF
jgi:DNA-binding transcriptional LysR family regulator